MASVSHTLEYAAALTGCKLVQQLSPRMADRFGSGLGSLAHAVMPSRRRIAHENLRLALGDTLTEDQRHQVVKRVFQNVGRTLVEFARFERTGIEGARSIIEGHGLEILRRVAAEGRGAICVTAHFGNWELLGSWVVVLGYPMDFLVGTQHNKKVDDMLVRFRREMGVGIIPLASSARQVFKALKAGHFVGLVADQHASSGGVRLDFFGRPAATPKGPALFSVRSGSPVVPFLLRRERYDHHVMMPTDPIYPPNSGDEEADICSITQTYTRFFERSIRQYPDQWLWTHRRWKVDDTRSGGPAHVTGEAETRNRHDSA